MAKGIAFSMYIKSPQKKEEFDKYYRLRWEILRKPWAQAFGSERDEFEDEGFHVGAFEDDNVIGVGRLHFITDTQCQIRYMAVEENRRRQGVGNAILNELEKEALNRGAKEIVLNARSEAVSFYQQNGYRVIEQAHTLFGCIKHFKMIKKID